MLYLWQSGSQFVRYRRTGPLVHLWWLVSQPSASYWTCPAQLPEGFRPWGNTYLPAVLTNASGYATDHVALACVEGGGTVGLQAGAAVAGAMNRGYGCFAALRAQSSR